MNNGTPKSRELRLRVHSASLETSRTSPRCSEVLEVLLSDTAPTPTPVCAMGRQLPPPLPLLGLTPTGNQEVAQTLQSCLACGLDQCPQKHLWVLGQGPTWAPAMLQDMRHPHGCFLHGSRASPANSPPEQGLAVGGMQP